MKRILFIATTNLHGRSGGALAALAYYNAVRANYGSIVDLALPEEFSYGTFEEAIPVPKRSKYISYIEIFKGRFHRYKDFFCKFLRKKSENYDIAIINGGFYAGDMVKMFQSYGLKVIVIHHNYEPEYHIDNKTLPTLHGLTSYFVKKNECAAYRYADLNAFLTNSDILLHQQHYGNGRQEPFLLGVFEPVRNNASYKEIHEAQANYHKRIVITGSMNSVQTVRGIMDFKQRYFPILRSKFPDWKIVIAGRKPAESIKQFQENNKDVISLIPNPSNIDEVISLGSIFLCPTNVGGGLKLRIMDGLKNGLPVLTHRVSARGYEIFEKQPFFYIYDDELSFETGLTNLIEIVQKHQTSRSQIYSLYNSAFSFEAGCKRIREMINLV